MIKALARLQAADIEKRGSDCQTRRPIGRFASRSCTYRIWGDEDALGGVVQRLVFDCAVLAIGNYRIELAEKAFALTSAPSCKNAAGGWRTQPPADDRPPGFSHPGDSGRCT